MKETSSEGAIVLVPGFLAPVSLFGRGMGKAYWGAALEETNDRVPVLSVEPSGVGSLHDRACEIFFQLRGGRVDYGEAHAKEHKHARFGRSYSNPLFPQWSRDKPIHLCGHSYGGQTCRMLLHLCEIGYFEAYGVRDGSWIRSVTTISAPLNGSLGVYALGAKVRRANKRERSEVVFMSPGFCLGCCLQAYQSCLVPAWVRKRLLFDMGMEQWPSGLGYLISSICVRSDVFEGRDSANYDMQPHVAELHNAQFRTRPDVYYFSFASSLDSDANEKTSSVSSWIVRCRKCLTPTHCAISSALVAAWSMMWWTYGLLLMYVLKWYVLDVAIDRVFDEVTRTECLSTDDVSTWCASGSDGLVTKSSQKRPRHSEAPYQDIDIVALRKTEALTPGRWYCGDIDGAVGHLGLVPFPHSKTWQRDFFARLFAALRSLPPPDAGA